ncbi:MAG TPA: PQQ-binding-like beta-propeller repeat protein [Armatimonadota bacterium]|jgi:outer membrane protein assembly factor BamB
MPQPFARHLARALFPVILGVALAAAVRAADWPMFLGGPSHVNISTETLSVPMALEWKFKTTYYANNPVAPVVAGHTLFLASQSNLYALDAETGEQKWKYPAEGPIGTPTAATIKATPAVADGLVFVGASDGVMYAIDAATGTLKWQYQTNGHIRFAPTIVDKTLYFGSDDYKVYALDVDTGKPAMDPIKTENSIVGSPAFADNLLYFTSADLHFYAANASTGNLKYKIRLTNGNVYSSPVASDRYVFVVGGNVLYAMMRSGSVRWAYTAHNPITNTPLVTDDGVYFGDRAGRFYGLDAKGREKWTITDNAARTMLFTDKPKPTAAAGSDPYLQLAGAVFSSAIQSGKNILVGTNRGFLYAIDAATGKVNWEYGMFADLPKGTYPNIASPPVIANGRLYVMSDDGFLHCFAPGAMDAEPPHITDVTPIRATQMNGSPPILMGGIVSDEGSGINASTIQLTLDDEPVSFTYQPNSGWVYYRTPVTQPIQPLESKRHSISLSVKDWKGNKATETWSFIVDNTLAPSVIETPGTSDVGGNAVGGAMPG